MFNISLLILRIISLITFLSQPSPLLTCILLPRSAQDVSLCCFYFPFPKQIIRRDFQAVSDTLSFIPRQIITINGTFWSKAESQCSMGRHLLTQRNFSFLSPPTCSPQLPWRVGGPSVTDFGGTQDCRGKETGSPICRSGLSLNKWADITGYQPYSHTLSF